MVSIGKTLSGLALIAATATQCSQTVRAHDDYGIGWDKEVALYNLSKIMGEDQVCNFGTNDNYVNSDSFYCGTGEFRFFPYHHQVPRTTNLRWTQIVDVKVQGNCVVLNENEEHQICALNPFQADDLAKAIKIYVSEVKKSSP